MKKICFIRHGESRANAGAKTQDPALIELTPKGIEQAKEISRSFQEVPALIATSRYIRTKQTAQPTIERFQNVICEEWDIHEFTYLSPPKYPNTNGVERLPFANDYWMKGDPFYKDGEGAESFSEFVGRCAQTIDRLQKMDGDLILAFSHGQFMAGIQWLLEGKLSNLNKKTIQDFRAYLISDGVKNCGKFKFDL